MTLLQRTEKRRIIFRSHLVTAGVRILVELVKVNAMDLCMVVAVQPHTNPVDFQRPSAGPGYFLNPGIQIAARTRLTGCELHYHLVLLYQVFLKLCQRFRFLPFKLLQELMPLDSVTGDQR